MPLIGHCIQQRCLWLATILNDARHIVNTNFWLCNSKPERAKTKNTQERSKVGDFKRKQNWVGTTGNVKIPKTFSHGIYTNLVGDLFWPQKWWGVCIYCMKVTGRMIVHNFERTLPERSGMFHVSWDFLEFSVLFRLSIYFVSHISPKSYYGKWKQTQVSSCWTERVYGETLMWIAAQQCWNKITFKH